MSRQVVRQPVCDSLRVIKRSTFEIVHIHIQKFVYIIWHKNKSLETWENSNANSICKMSYRAPAYLGILGYKTKKKEREVFAADSPQTKSVNVKMPKLIAMAAPWIKLQETAGYLPACQAAMLYTRLWVKKRTRTRARVRTSRRPALPIFLGAIKATLVSGLLSNWRPVHVK